MQTTIERANGNNHRAPAAVTECYMLGNIRSGGWCPTERGSMNDLFTNKSKEEIAIERLQAFEPKDGTGYYCAFSGGKDSIVILDLLKRSGCKFDAHYNVTTVDPPELVRFIKTFPEVQFNYPEMSMWKFMSRGGYRPGTGRPKGAKDSKPRKGSKAKKAPGKSDKKKIQELLDLGTKAKARMYQDFLISASPAPLTIKNNSSVTAAPFSAGPFRRPESIRIAEAQNLGPGEL